ncbi:MAG: aspartate-semialdehyde dehydrogenase, partial [candidate division Zixibacteria bacterium]|nr:aspartate-semialdehyde dehydrogenase [candidate division Zixibacteria bacterium]
QIRAASYQAVTGAGAAALRELKNQLRTWAKGGNPPEPKALPQTIAFNVFPHIGSFDSSGYSGEEIKVAQECRKIMGLPALKISCTTVRVPVIRGHSLALWLETKKPIDVKKCRNLLINFDGAQLLDAPKLKKYPTPCLADSKWPVYIGRLRRGENSKELLMWVSGDNLLKGAALNSVQIAEYMIKKGFL